MVRKGNLVVFQSSSISKTKEAMPTKFGVHALHIHPYLYEFYELILFDSIFWLPWTTTLQPLTGESMRLHTASIDDGARLDISAEDFWGHRYQYVFFDVRVFCPLSSANRSRSLMACYRENKEIKKRKYDQRIREVEHASFAPLIFSTSGGFGPISTLFIKRLSHLHAEKFQRPYSIVINYIRCRYSFSHFKIGSEMSTWVSFKTTSHWFRWFLPCHLRCTVGIILTIIILIAVIFVFAIICYFLLLFLPYPALS